MSHSLKDVYQAVTDKIIASLESGVPPWIHPWQSQPHNHVPFNLSSGRNYRGINVLLLNLRSLEAGFGVNQWMTYQQARSLGAHVRKGESGTEIIFFKMHEFGAGSDAVPSGPRPREHRIVPLIRTFTVFNAEQIEGLPASLKPVLTPRDEWVACDAADAVLSLSGATIKHGGLQAFYSPDADLICLPDKTRFASAADYYRVALHELTHWTSHAKRCNRPIQGRQHIEAYAFEELVAEMGSAFLTDHCGLPSSLQHATYIESWLKALRNDKKLIFTAASQAQRAADFLLPQVIEPVAEELPACIPLSA